MKQIVIHIVGLKFILISSLILFFGSTSFFAATVFQEDQNPQSYIEYHGAVMDSNSKEPLTFANLNVKDTNISTISNPEGEFVLKVPTEYSNNLLIVSFLGYNTKEVQLSEFINEPLKIFLVPSITQLSEVNVKAPKNAQALVQATLNLKGENYYNKEAIMTAFYRETIKKRRRNASLAEAVVEIYKQPYDSQKKDAIKLIKARKSTDYSRLDTLAVKLQGGPFSTLYTDFMKYPEFIFTENNLGEYIFSFDNSTEIDGKVVYVVKFKQRPNIAYPLYYGKLYIDSESYALTSAIYNLNVENKKLAAEIFVRKKPRKVEVYPTEAAYRVDYRIKDGKWYYGYSNILLTFKVNWKGKLFNSVYTLNSEMAVTDWEQNLTGIDHPKETLKPTVIMSDEASGFSDPDFWGAYNIIEPEKSIESAIKKINKQLKRT